MHYYSFVSIVVCFFFFFKHIYTLLQITDDKDLKQLKNILITEDILENPFVYYVATPQQIYGLLKENKHGDDLLKQEGILELCILAEKKRFDLAKESTSPNVDDKDAASSVSNAITYLDNVIKETLKRDPSDFASDVLSTLMPTLTVTINTASSPKDNWSAVDKAVMNYVFESEKNAFLDAAADAMVTEIKKGPHQFAKLMHYAIVDKAVDVSKPKVTGKILMFGKLQKNYQDLAKSFEPLSKLTSVPLHDIPGMKASIHSAYDHLVSTEPVEFKKLLDAIDKPKGTTNDEQFSDLKDTGVKLQKLASDVKDNYLALIKAVDDQVKTKLATPDQTTVADILAEETKLGSSDAPTSLKLFVDKKINTVEGSIKKALFEEGKRMAEELKALKSKDELEPALPDSENVNVDIFLNGSLSLPTIDAIKLTSAYAKIKALYTTHKPKTGSGSASDDEKAFNATLSAVTDLITKNEATANALTDPDKKSILDILKPFRDELTKLQAITAKDEKIKSLSDLKKLETDLNASQPKITAIADKKLPVFLKSQAQTLLKDCQALVSRINYSNVDKKPKDTEFKEARTTMTNIEGKVGKTVITDKEIQELTKAKSELENIVTELKIEELPPLPTPLLTPPPLQPGTQPSTVTESLTKPQPHLPENEGNESGAGDGKSTNQSSLTDERLKKSKANSGSGGWGLGKKISITVAIVVVVGGGIGAGVYFLVIRRRAAAANNDLTFL